MVSEDQIKEIIRTYAAESLSEVILKVQRPKPFMEPRNGHLMVNIDSRINWTGIGDIDQLRLTYLFDSLVGIHLNGLKLPLIPVEPNRFSWCGWVYFTTKHAFTLEDIDSRYGEYREALHRCLSCPEEDLPIYLVDNQVGVREIAELRASWYQKTP